MNGYVSTRKLAVGYPRRIVLDGITMDIPQGEVVTVIGPNGAGKTTLLKSIAGLLKKAGGSISIGGEDLEKLGEKALAKRMAVVLTDKVRTDKLTCRDIVALGRIPYTGRLGIAGKEDEAAAERALAAVGAGEFADRDFMTVSDGQRQRVLIARALCQEPEIIVLDEPASWLDIRYRLEILELLRTLASREQITILMSMHELDLAMKISDRVLVAGDGKLIAQGPPGEIFQDEKIRRLFSLTEGSFDTLLGSTELSPPEGAPRVFVLCGMGLGTPLFRMLRNKGVPFAAGILYENDVDFRTARALAGEVISAKPFFPVPEEAYEEAAACAARCGRILDAGEAPGYVNPVRRRFLEAAKEKGIPVITREEAGEMEWTTP